MEKPSSIFNKDARSPLWMGVLAAGLALAFSSCFDMEVRIRFTDLTQGTVEADYTVDARVAGMTRADGSPVVPLPTERQGWETYVSQVPGAGLSSFRKTSGPDGVRVEVGLTFSNPRALESLFTVTGQKLVLLLQGNSWILTQSFQKWDLPAPTPEALDIARAVLGDKKVRLEVRPPRPVVSVSAGELQDERRTAILVRTWDDLIRPQASEEWRIVW